MFLSILIIIHTIPNKVNMAIFKDVIRASTTNNMHVDDSLLVDTWQFLKFILVASTESLFDILE